MQKVANNVVLINGVANDVGENVSLAFAKLGAKVVVVDRDKAKVDAVVARVKDAKAEALGVVVDVADAAQVKGAVKQALDKFGKIDVLVNNVSVVNAKSALDLTDAEWKDTLLSDLNPMFAFCREVLPAMREKKYGRVVNIGSMYYLGWPGKANLSAATSAIPGFTRSIALETANDRITANCVAVGDIANPALSEADVAKLVASIPVMRLGTPDDVSNAVTFFASETSKYVTGQTLFVCGGKCVHFSMSM
ncbi:MAG: SDR family NAD(P)-dependent oxidoreductase [Syntrophobacteraceae bacterium]